MSPAEAVPAASGWHGLAIGAAIMGAIGGLAWLAKNQGAEGNWGSNDLGLTSMGALASMERNEPMPLFPM